MVKTVIRSNNAIDFSASVANRSVSPLHQGGNIGLTQAKQEKITIVHVVVCQFGELLANERNKPRQMLFCGIAYSQYLLFTQCVVLVNQIIHLRLELTFVCEFDNIEAYRGINKCRIIIGSF